MRRVANARGPKLTRQYPGVTLTIALSVISALGACHSPTEAPAQARSGST
jgi:hypothetical protein